MSKKKETKKEKEEELPTAPPPTVEETPVKDDRGQEIGSEIDINDDDFTSDSSSTDEFVPLTRFQKFKQRIKRM